MESEVYRYSKYQPWFMLITFGGLEIYFLYIVIDLFTDKIFIGSSIFAIILVLNAIGLVYVTKKYLIPAINDDVAIELDEEKIQYNIGNWELCWTEIKKIESVLYGMKLTLKNDDEIYISLQYVAGNWDRIKDAINEYFENA